MPRRARQHPRFLGGGTAPLHGGMRFVGGGTQFVGGGTAPVRGGTRFVGGGTTPVCGGTRFVGGGTTLVCGCTRFVGDGTTPRLASIILRGWRCGVQLGPLWGSATKGLIESALYDRGRCKRVEAALAN